MECTFCGREVKPTVHRREGFPPFTVDYYLLLTGKLERTVMQDLLAESARVEFYKLVEPRWVVTCAECYRQEATAAELVRWFAGLPEEEGAVAAAS